MIINYGCKKADSKNIVPPGEKTIEMLRADVAKQMEHVGGVPQVFTRNQKVTTQWVDQYHNPVTKEQMQNNNFTSQCNYDLPAYCNLVQYARVYACGNSGSGGYFLQFEYEISWNNNITKIAGTTGYAVIVDGSNNTVQTLAFDTTNSDVEIVEIGPDPNPSYPNNYIFRVKFISTNFTTQSVPEAYINSGNYDVKFSATFGTDCKAGGNPYSLWLLPVTTYGFTGASGYSPCQRNDIAWVVSVPGPGSNLLIVSGYDGSFNTNCGFGGSFVATDLQEVEYNVDGGTWLPMNNYTATSSWPIYGSAFIRGTEFCKATIVSGDHLVGLRYRNWKYVNTNPSGWPLPNPNSPYNDCFSPGDDPSNNTNSTPYSTWAYKYLPCIGIP